MRRVTRCCLVLLSFLRQGGASIAQGQTAATFHPTAPVLPMRLAIGPADGSSSQGKTAEEIFRQNYRLALSGNPDAAFEVGLQYAEGVGVPHDPALAEQWLSRGAHKAEDKRILAQLYVGGWYFDQSATKAAYWFRAAGQPGDLFELAEMYRKAKPSQPDRAIPIYLELLRMEGHPEARRAQLELGNFVLDGKYRKGADAASRMQELAWARSIAQELLGQAEYNMAVDYAVGRAGIPVNGTMWAKYCTRAAAYDIDLAQQFLAEGILQGAVAGATITEGYAWLRLASEKQTTLKKEVESGEAKMDASSRSQAEQAYADFVNARKRYGAYYRRSDPLREAASGMGKEARPAEDPDLALRRAFELEQSNAPDEFEAALEIYREIRDQRAWASMLKLGRALMLGTDEVQKDPVTGSTWLKRAAAAGSREAAVLLAHGQGE